MQKIPDTEQLQHWSGEFGQGYIQRNMTNPDNLRARTALWSDVMSCMMGQPPKAILEVGSNVGSNLLAIQNISDAELFAVEPFDDARKVLIEKGVVKAENAFAASAQSIPMEDGSVDMAFTNGVLIHIHPDNLLDACREIYRTSRRYIVCIEYFSDKAETIPYHGHDNLLFKRDFGGFWMDNFPDLRVMNYGFNWKRVTGMDNLTWWVFEKNG